MRQSIWPAIKIIGGALIGSFIFVQLGSSELFATIAKLSQDVIILVLGVVIAVAGIQFGAVGTIYSHFRKELDNPERKSRTGVDHLRNSLAALDHSFDELRQNTLFLLLTYAFTISMLLLESVSIPYLVWPIQYPGLSKEAVFAALQLTGLVLGFYATFDSVQAMFVIMKIYRKVSLSED